MSRVEDAVTVAHRVASAFVPPRDTSGMADTTASAAAGSVQTPSNADQLRAAFKPGGTTAGSFTIMMTGQNSGQHSSGLAFPLSAPPTSSHRGTGKWRVNVRDEHGKRHRGPRFDNEHDAQAAALAEFRRVQAVLRGLEPGKTDDSTDGAPSVKPILLPAPLPAWPNAKRPATDQPDTQPTQLKQPRTTAPVEGASQAAAQATASASATAPSTSTSLPAPSQGDLQAAGALALVNVPQQQGGTVGTYISSQQALLSVMGALEPVSDAMKHLLLEVATLPAGEKHGPSHAQFAAELDRVLQQLRQLYALGEHTRRCLS
ncbi:hypothetical protein WJX73_002584 [Symbiochloris irregularis]|uniref:AP2/ERF domain-containing protein n=1 Tax=Symbiochloris irregularis TaxID=706552 RepID=A0AAW1PY76_9CHLO